MNSSIIEKLYKAGVIDHSRHVNLEALETYTLTHDILVVMHTPSLSHVTLLRAVVEKWTFQDKAMGEQYLTFDYQSEEPVVWQVGDYCIFRGETYTLNYIPSVTQTGGYHKSLSSYKYEGVRMDSYADELTRCQMLDVVLTSGQHDPSAGTNYTGSSRFDLFCGETTVDGVTRTAVMTLGDRMLANLNRMYRDDQDEPLWSIEYGEDTHTEDQRLQFDNQSVVQALAEVKNKFDLNYSIRGRVITIGGTIENVTDVTYGYGEGYPTEEDGGKALFEIKKISDSNQKIVTRLRVLGSTKNLPYRYYNKKYNLPQALFPTALQLPDTFLALGTPDDTTGANTKWGQNKERRADPATAGLRYVLGETNDAYIDKNDNARNTVEGIREATVRFDGSDSKLKEIYPTIEEVLYSELRAAGVEDQDGATGSSAFPGYDGDEYINRLLAVGHKVDGTLTDDANIGNGILSEDNVTRYGDVSDILVSAHQESLTLGAHGWRYGTERTLFTLSGQEQGKYFFTPVAGQEPWFDYSAAHESAQIAFIIRVKQTVSGTTTVIAEYVSDFMSGVGSVMLPSVPDAFFMDDAKVQEIAVTATADITVTFTAVSKAVSSLQYRIGLRDGGTAQYVWSSLDDMDSANMPFHVFVKDMGFDFAAQFNGETPQIVMKGGQCVGRSFQIGENVQKVEYDGKKGYMLTLTRDSDSSLNTYYPSSQAQLSADDPFVLVGIDMPDAYIEAAEMRLLSAATEWLAENGDTHFRYQPSIDDKYLKRDYDNNIDHVEDSVFWKLYAGLALSFVPVSADPAGTDPAAVSVTIESVTITMGEGLTRKVDITLNDELRQSTLTRVTQAVESLQRQVQEGMKNTEPQSPGKQYLSRTDNDTAAGDITFNGVIRFNKAALFPAGAYFGQDQDGGFTAQIDPDGNIHTDKNVEAEGGVSAKGIADLSEGGEGGGGGASSASINGGTQYESDENGNIDITLELSELLPTGGIPKSYLESAVQISLGKADTALQSINSTLVINALGFTPFDSASFTQANIKTTLGISNWALASTKPGYTFSEIGSKPTTLSGYGITDAKIENGVITLGGNAITPLTSHQTIRTLKIQKNGTDVDTYDPTASSNKTINLTDVASATALDSSVAILSSAIGGLKASLGDIAYMSASEFLLLTDFSDSNIVSVLGNTPVNRATGDKNGNDITTYYTTVSTFNAYKTSLIAGSHNLPIYIDSSGAHTIDSLRVSGNIESTNGGVSANGIASLAVNSSGGSGGVSSVCLGQGTEPYIPDANGLLTLPAYPVWDTLVGKPTLATVATSGSYNDLSNKPNNATTSASGFMSASDKTKLDGIASGATNVSESTVSGWGFTKNAGTVTSVQVKVSSGSHITVDNASAVTSSGSYTLGIESGYSIPSDASQTAWTNKQDSISDLNTIRSNASNGNTAYGYFSSGILKAANMSAANIVSALGTTAVNRATADASGNTIASTYETKANVSQYISALSVGLGAVQASLGSMAYRSSDEYVAYSDASDLMQEFSYSGRVVNLVYSGKAWSITIPLATTSIDGLVSTSAQTFGGDKTFADEIYGNKNIQADYGVSAKGIADLGTGAGGGIGTVTSVQFKSDVSYALETAYIPNENGLISLPPYPSNISDISGLQTALDSKLSTALKGVASGLAELDSAGKVPSSQLPSYVDDVLEYDSLSNFPATGETGKIYVAKDTNKTYRWGGSSYVEISPSLALGETSSTAYRGDRGKTAYDHATDSSRLTTAQISGLYKIAVTAQGHVASVTAVVKDDITDLGIPAQDTTYTFYNLAFQNASGTTVDTYKPTTSPSKTVKAGSNVTISASSNVITIAATDTTYSNGTGLALSNGVFSITSTYQDYISHGNTAYGYFTNGLLNKANHYTPASDSTSDYTASASGASAAWSIDVVKAVQIQRDSKGHILGVTVTSGKIPAKPTYAFSDLTSHPTTLDGYGITDAATATDAMILSRGLGLVSSQVNDLHDNVAMMMASDANVSDDENTKISFIDDILKDPFGNITAIRRTVRDAGASQSGVVSISAQTFSGDKTFNDNIQSEKGVSAKGMADLSINGGGGIGTVTSILLGSTSYPPNDNGVVELPAYPTVNNATLTIQKNGSTLSSFTANASSNVTCNITVPTKVSDLTNDTGFITGITSSMVTTALGYTPYNSTNPAGYTTNTGTVTSIQVKVSSGSHLTVDSSSAVTTSGSYTIGVASDYSIPLTADTNKGVTAYGWGNHASAGYAIQSNVEAYVRTLTSGLGTLKASLGTMAHRSSDEFVAYTDSADLVQEFSSDSTDNIKLVFSGKEWKITQSALRTSLGLGSAAYRSDTYFAYSVGETGGGNAYTGFSFAAGVLLLTKGTTFKTQQTAKSDPTASGNALSFIDSISQDANGVITATKKTIYNASSLQAGIVTTGEQTFAGDKTFTGSVIAPTLTLNSTSAVSHLAFTGASTKYISFANNQHLNICPDGTASTTLAYRFTKTALLPVGTLYLGSSTNKWAGIYTSAIELKGQSLETSIAALASGIGEVRGMMGSIASRSANEFVAYVDAQDLVQGLSYTASSRTISLTFSGKTWSTAIPLADASTAGLVSTSTQTFAGAKTFTGAVSLSSTLSVSGIASLTVLKMPNDNYISFKNTSSTDIRVIAMGGNNAFLLGDYQNNGGIPTHVHGSLVTLNVGGVKKAEVNTSGLTSYGGVAAMGIADLSVN